MTYWRYWQLSGAPFDGSGFFRGATMDEALARIEFLVSNRRAMGAVCGANGVGKSAVLQHFADNPPVGSDIPSLELIRTSVMGMSGGELLGQVARKLSGGRLISDAPTAWKLLCDCLRASSRERTQVVLLVDDAESANTAVETELSRLLTMNFPLTIILAVNSQLISAVSRSIMERCELQIELPVWDLTQTAEFLAWMSIRRGRMTPIFTDAAVERIHELSRGLARRVVQLADLALVAGAVAQADCVDVDCIEQVVWELPKSSAA